MEKLKLSILILLVFVSLGGCAEPKLLEKIGLTTLVGYDFINGDNLSTTAVIRSVDPDFESNVEIISSENHSSKGTRTETNRKTSKKVMSGQMRVVLFGEELAKNNIAQFINTFSKDSSISGSVYIAVAEGETKPLLTYQYENIKDIGQHVFKLLEQNIEGEQLVSPTLHEVAHDYYSVGKDLAIPIIKRDEELIAISGLALFNKGKMVGRLPAEDGFYVKITRDVYNAAMFETIINSDDLPSSKSKNTSDGIAVVLDTIQSKKDLILVNETTPEFDLNIEVSARLLETSADLGLGEPKNIVELEKAINKRMSSELSRVISYSQEVGSDVFGFGEHYRSSVRQSKLTHEKWHEIYKEAKINVNFDVKILRVGVFE